MNKYYYARVPGVHLGEFPMRCNACHKPIESGQFRYRETSKSYVKHHRSCSQEDPQWAKLDAEENAASERNKEFIADCDAFYAKWGTSDFSDWRSP